MAAAGLFHAVQRGDVRVIQRGEHTSLALKTQEPVAIGEEFLEDNLQGDVAAKPGVPGLIDGTHAAFTEKAGDFIRTEPRARRERHGAAPLCLLRTSPTRIHFSARSPSVRSFQLKRFSRRGPFPPAIGRTMQQMKWLVTLCLSPLVALAFLVAICGVLVLSLTAELQQDSRRSK